MAEPAIGPSISVVVPAGDQPEALGRCLGALEVAKDAARRDHRGRRSPRSRDRRCCGTSARGGPPGTCSSSWTRTSWCIPRRSTVLRAAFAADASLAAVFGRLRRTAGGRRTPCPSSATSSTITSTRPGPASWRHSGQGSERCGGTCSTRSAASTRPLHPGAPGGRGHRPRPAPARLGTPGPARPRASRARTSSAGRWREMIRVDVRVRGASWVALMLQRRRILNGLNLAWRHRVSAIGSLVIVQQALGRRALGRALVLVGGQVWLNRRPVRARARGPRGWRAAAFAVPLHIVHHLICALAVPWGLWRLQREALPGRRARGRAAPRRASSTNPAALASWPATVRLSTSGRAASPGSASARSDEKPVEARARPEAALAGTAARLEWKRARTAAVAQVLAEERAQAEPGARARRRRRARRGADRPARASGRRGHGPRRSGTPGRSRRAARKPSRGMARLFVARKVGPAGRGRCERRTRCRGSPGSATAKGFARARSPRGRRPPPRVAGGGSREHRQPVLPRQRSRRP